MARPAPTIQAPAWQEPSLQDTLTLHLRLITPLFGGGYEAREVDPVCIIRPATIRGHLRFWWRALYGARYPSSQEMFKAESQLWGAAAKKTKNDNSDEQVGETGASPVAIRVRITNPGMDQECAEFEWNQNRHEYRALPRFRRGYPAYALFPFQGQVSPNRRQILIQPATARENVEFELILSCPPSVREEVLSAVNAWVKYGGIGARTRRGCGSLMLTTSLDLPFQMGPTSAGTCVPLLPGSKYVLGSETDDPLQAWEQAVRAYQDFRQSVPFARNPGADGRPGRSKYPEPDSIRRKTMMSSQGHEPEHPVNWGFPRADLGFPIVFHFKDSRYGDPPDTILQGSKQGRARMASPVITKAIAVAAGTYRPLVMVLNTPHAWLFGDLVLVVAGSDRLPVTQKDIELTPEERKQVEPLSGKRIREALLDYVAGKWQGRVEELR